MFSYYGSKSKIIHRYPEPRYKTIIEPFAGSGRYALRYFDRDVWLNDKYKIVADIWRWMIDATAEQIQAIPEMQRGDDVRNLDVPAVMRDLLGFSVNRGVAYPHNVLSTWAHEGGGIPRMKRRLMKHCGKLRHWKITDLDYRELPDIEATWFIDPPYQTGGERYIENAIDFAELGEWCKSRRGQVIVCENEGADWLPFERLVSMRGQRHTRTEMIWQNSI